MNDSAAAYSVRLTTLPSSDCCDRFCYFTCHCTNNQELVSTINLWPSSSTLRLRFAIAFDEGRTYLLRCGLLPEIFFWVHRKRHEGCGTRDSAEDVVGQGLCFAFRALLMGFSSCQINATSGSLCLASVRAILNALRPVGNLWQPRRPDR
jgi:hypothetical protein